MSRVQVKREGTENRIYPGIVKDIGGYGEKAREIGCNLGIQRSSCIKRIGGKKGM